MPPPHSAARPSAFPRPPGQGVKRPVPLLLSPRVFPIPSFLLSFIPASPLTFFRCAGPRFFLRGSLTPPTPSRKRRRIARCRWLPKMAAGARLVSIPAAGGTAGTIWLFSVPIHGATHDAWPTCWPHSWGKIPLYENGSPASAVPRLLKEYDTDREDGW